MHIMVPVPIVGSNGSPGGGELYIYHAPPGGHNNNIMMVL
jgi:hypothetical protein